MVQALPQEQRLGPTLWWGFSFVGWVCLVVCKQWWQFAIAPLDGATVSLLLH
jgi:hypothetical protein